MLHRGLQPIATAISFTYILLLMAGCIGGAQLVLKSPIQDQCTSAGLMGCEEIADGVTLYADGHSAEGGQKLGRGLRANATKAAELKKFADGLTLARNIPGAGQYVAMLQPAIELVQQVAAEAEAQQAQQAQQQPPTPAPAPTIESQSRRARSTERQVAAQHTSAIGESEDAAVAPARRTPLSVATFWLPTGNALAVGCRFPGTPKMLCLIERIDTPKQITDLMVSPACPVDVLVSCRHGLENDWVVYAPAGKGADIHGALLPIAPRQALTIGLAQKTDDALSDIRCGVSAVWHAMPDATPDKTPQQNASEPIPDPPPQERVEPTSRKPGF